MLNKIEHLGIAVKSLEEAQKTFDDLMDANSYKTEVVDSEGVRTMFYQIGESKIELLEATNPNSPIAKFIEKKGEGIHHIAFDVDNVADEIKRLSDKGFKLINETPKRGADNKNIAFLHPKSTNSVLIELCEDRSM